MNTKHMFPEQLKQSFQHVSPQPDQGEVTSSDRSAFRSRALRSTYRGSVWRRVYSVTHHKDRETIEKTVEKTGLAGSRHFERLGGDLCLLKWLSLRSCYSELEVFLTSVARFCFESEAYVLPFSGGLETRFQMWGVWVLRAGIAVDDDVIELTPSWSRTRPWSRRLSRFEKLIHRVQSSVSVRVEVSLRSFE